jgi:hypothetical protein
MNEYVIKVAFGLLLLAPAFPGNCQEKPTKPEPQAVHTRAEGPQLKVQLVLTEMEGDKKVKSLPYMLLVRAGVAGGEREWSKIRIGSRIPIVVDSEKGGDKIQYMDLGSNIDCRAVQAEDGSYRLTMNLERSWAEGRVSVAGDPSGAFSSSDKPELASTPLIRQFKSESTVTVRDGQPLETTFATDPFTGKGVRLEVTVTALK